jgi:hypothetical protein
MDKSPASYAPRWHSNKGHLGCDGRAEGANVYLIEALDLEAAAIRNNYANIPVVWYPSRENLPVAAAGSYCALYSILRSVLRQASWLRDNPDKGSELIRAPLLLVLVIFPWLSYWAIGVC